MESIPIARCLCLAAAFGTAGCATVLNGSRQELTVNSNPPGAYFEVDGLAGVTPGTVPVARKQHQHTVTISKPGYQTSQMRVGRRLNPWLAGNLLLGYVFPVGVLVDFYKGSAYQLGTDNVQVDLQPE